MGGASDTGATTTTPPSTTGTQPGTLTAGSWDDNLNFDFFLSYLTKVTPSGVPSIPRTDRVVLQVRDAAGAPLPGARVEVRQNGALLLSVESPSDGNVYVFPAWLGASAQASLEVTARASGATATASLASAAGTQELRVPGTTAGAVTALDVAIVLDTTGSMGDEISYLKTEVDSIAADVASRFVGVPQRWALVLYRDEGDAYVTSVTDFTTLSAFKTALSHAAAAGGGDYPEAVHAAMTAVGNLSWLSGATARLAFHVADAPQHGDKGPAVADALKNIVGRSVRYYPVASSGVDELFEQTFRSAAEVTGGRYLFLTNDSGVGGDHKEPTIPCYSVTKLHEAMVRMISMELSGTHLDPLAADVLRTSGSPANGQCTLANGTKVSLF